MTSYLSINFMPNAIYKPELCIRTTLAAAKEANFPINRIIFEVLENEAISDIPKLTSIFKYYQTQGFLTAIDDFGAGHADIGLLAEF